ncbi:MAG: type II toxin-antitoxin system prevent-host-death family antitoxin [bacterium]|nr:type II toxin-antitoxin system prevent-host-death family antitoxin [bacterium]MCY3578983.1 type II toxin-antitoxin system prevent-host-death family antitoxin [bacterium]MCY3652212.1 type II toxin-antitoxin system prevent-host-death family antitoxin [bacterium]MXX65216.1 type II toxin-antitoxin system prevent-host-death family antitoxin [Acidimicrobiia bacterium]MYD03568.1 type II toxin-antitoxin system prevent-host-death family antitoxin [Acidimicrobiia bacterium]
MLTVTIEEAEINLAQLVEGAVQGVPFIIAKAGKPLVKVVALDTPDPKATRRTGFLPGISVPEDFNRMGESETQ